MSVIVDYINIADEVFIATALLHREHPYRDDFTVQEIVSRVSEENLYGGLAPGPNGCVAALRRKQACQPG